MKKALPKKTMILLICHFFWITTIVAQNFINPLPIPDLIDQDTVELTIDPTMHNFNPNGTNSLNSLVPAYGYNIKGQTSNTLLGPSIAWRYGHNVVTKITNNLPVLTTVHWHGAHIPVHTDGGPHQRIPPGATWNIEFEIKDKSSTMWYHPHAFDITYEQVQLGLSGMIYVEDPPGGTADDDLLNIIHDIIPHDYGVNDFPIIAQTKKFKLNADDNQILIQSAVDNGYKDDFDYLVNGVVDPFLHVQANMVRLRILNGDGKFAFNFGLEDSDGSTTPLQLIATDAGYTDQSYELEKILMGSGERTEWLVDLRGRAGDTLYLMNYSASIPDGIIGGVKPRASKGPNNYFNTNTRLLRIIVDENTLPPSPIIAFPINLHPSEAPPITPDTKIRTKNLLFGKVEKKDGTLTSDAIYNIDQILMDTGRVNDTVFLDTDEVWVIDNQTDVAHPWHIHDTHFWVTSIIDSTGTELNKSDYPDYFGGPLDNVLVRPGWTLSYIISFRDYATTVKASNTYMYHCHILPHEDQGMMHQWVVTTPELLTDVGELEIDHPYKLYPNPTANHLYLESSTTETSRIRFFDINGRFLQQQRIPAFDGTTKIELIGLPKGMIWMEWTMEKGVLTRKVVLE